MSRYKRIPEAARLAAASYTQEWPSLPVHGTRTEDIVQERRIQREKQATLDEAGAQAARMSEIDQFPVGAMLKRMASDLWGHGAESSEVIRHQADNALDGSQDGSENSLHGITQRMASQDLTRID